MCDFFYSVAKETPRDLIYNASSIEEYEEKYRRFASVYLNPPWNSPNKPPNGFDRACFITAFNQGSCNIKRTPMSEGPLGFVEYRENTYPINPMETDFAGMIRRECIRSNLHKNFGLSYIDLMEMPFDEAMKILEDGRKESEREEQANREMREVVKSMEALKHSQSQTK